MIEAVITGIVADGREAVLCAGWSIQREGKCGSIGERFNR